MKRALTGIVVLAVAGFTMSEFAAGQLPQTRLSSLFPPGGQRGTTVEVTVSGGTDLDEVDQLILSHAGISSAPKLDAAGNPVVGTFIVSIDSSVPPGLYDARIRGLFGISNPRIFRVDTLPELQETEPDNSAAQATVVAMNSVVNGRSNAALDVDYYRFSVGAGQTAVIRSEAARIDSPMQPLLQVFSADGRRVAQSQRTFGQDATVVVTAETAQEMLLKVSDVVYAGGPDFTYRLAIDTRPLVDFVQPLVVSADQPTTVKVFGRYLPDGQPVDLSIQGIPLRQKEMTILPEPAGIGSAGFAAFSAPLDAMWWNGVDGNLIPLARSETAAVTDDESAGEQIVTAPVQISGHFAAIGDEDIWRFAARKGDTWWIEVFAHRQGLITDPLLLVEQVVTAADGKETYSRLGTEDDDRQDPGGADLPTLSADPAFQLVVPEDGTYRIRLRDRYGDSRGDPRLGYRLSIRPPRPDFRLVLFDAYPSADGKAPPTSGAVSLRKGGSWQTTVYAYRRDGHNQPIRVEFRNLPAGVTSPGATIGAGQVSATLILTASEAASELATPVQVVGLSGDGDTRQTAIARVATLVHDAINGLPRTARMSDSLVVGVMQDQEPFSIQIGPTVVDVSQDQQLLLPVTIQRRSGFEGKVDLAFSGVPANVDAPALAIEPGSVSATARLFFKDNAPVTVSTLVLHGTSAVPYRRNPWQAERAQQKVKDAESLLATRQQMATETTAALEAAQNTIKASTEQIAALGQAVSDLAAGQQQLQKDFGIAVAEYRSSNDELRAVREKLVAATAAKDGSVEDVDKALTEVAAATAAGEAAAARVTALTAKAQELSAALTAARELEKSKSDEKAAVEARVPDLMKQAEAAQAAVAAAQKIVEEAQAAKAAADAVLKTAEDASKPNNVNVRLVSTPVLLAVHPAPGKLAADVPNGGALKRASTLPVKVTLTRRNEFSGPMHVSLVAAGSSGVFSDTVVVAADQAEATITIAARADSPVADVANTVVRATGEFNGRAASIDIPITLKVTE